MADFSSNNTIATSENLGMLVPPGYVYNGLQSFNFVVYDTTAEQTSDPIDYFKFQTPNGVTQIKIEFDAIGIQGDKYAAYYSVLSQGASLASGSPSGFEISGSLSNQKFDISKTSSGVSAIYNVTPGEHYLQIRITGYDYSPGVTNGGASGDKPIQIDYSLKIQPQAYSTSQPTTSSGAGSTTGSGITTGSGTTTGSGSTPGTGVTVGSGTTTGSGTIGGATGGSAVGSSSGVGGNSYIPGAVILGSTPVPPLAASPSASAIPAAPSNGMTNTGSPFFQTNIEGSQAVYKPVAYSGPVAEIDWQYLGSSAPTETIAGTFQSDFINGLGGSDIVFGNDGNDILDGGTGSNYLVGGAGTDIFFTDARDGQAGWTTIADFKPGVEQVSIFGFRPGVSRVFWEDNYGAEGSKGATAFFDMDGSSQSDRSGVDFAVTFSGHSVNGLGASYQMDGLLWFRPTV